MAERRPWRRQRPYDQAAAAKYPSSSSRLGGMEVPGWLEFSPAELQVKIIGAPMPDEVPFDVNTNLIVEFYR